MMTKKKILIRKMIKTLYQVKKKKKKAMIMKAVTMTASLHQIKKKMTNEDMITKCTKTK
jgi:hypothetical protein